MTLKIKRQLSHTTQAERRHPAQWLRELTHVKKSAWPWRRSLRAAASVGVPLAVGFMTGMLPFCLWLALGAMLSAAGEGEGSWRSRYRQLAIATPIAVCGFLFGYLGSLPYPLLIAAIAMAAFVSALVSSYGSPYSSGSMQALVFAIISVGLPGVARPLQEMALFVGGVGIFAFFMSIEAITDRHSPERQMLAAYIRALARLADARPGIDGRADPSFEATRRAVIDQSAALYATLLEKRRNGRTHEIVTHAGVLDAAEQLFYAILAARDLAALHTLAAWLEQAAAAIMRRRRFLPGPDGADADGVLAAANLLHDRLLAGGEVVAESLSTPPAQRQSVRERLVRQIYRIRRLAVGRTVLMNGAAVAVCMAIAMSMHYVLPPNHWYWVPLTVALVMKPDLGSVFARAVLRTAGTLAGVVIGALIINLLPKGPELVLAIAMLAACLPWAKNVSYAVMTLALTPLVLVLLDMMSRGSGVVDLAPERLLNTAIGGAIALIFGYFIWPRSHSRELYEQFSNAMNAVADYVTAACAPAGGPVWRTGRLCYVALSEMRALVTRNLVEPPPAGREAAAWFPLILDAERICDSIATYGVARSANAERPPADQVDLVARALRLAGAEGAVNQSDVTDPFLQDVMRQVVALQRRMQAEANSIPHATPGQLPEQHTADV